MDKIDIEELIKVLGEKDLVILSLRQEIKRLKKEAAPVIKNNKVE